MILHDTRNPRSVAGYDALTRRLTDALPDDLAIVIGGDGFMLHCVAAHGLDRTYLGLNAGHLGFLLNAVDDWDAVANRIRSGTWSSQAFPLIHATAQTRDGEFLTQHAINDVYLERMTGQTARLSLTIDDHPVVSNMVTDGIIFCTALGSTAYSFSAGGTPCHPQVPVLGVTPICPHLPRLSPFILPETSVAEVEVQSAEHRPVRAVVDGAGADYIEKLTVRIAKEKVHLAYFDSRDLTATMLSKIVRRS